MLPYKKDLKKVARLLRRNLTPTEKIIWRRLRGKQVLGVQFCRQKPVAGFVVDFYCAAAQLVIEIDGGQHFESENKERDDERDQILRELGLQVLRFDNRQVSQEIEAVLAVVYGVVEARALNPSPTLPFTKGGS